MSTKYHVLEPIMLPSGAVAKPGDEIALTPGEYLHATKASPGCLEPLSVRDVRVEAEARAAKATEEARAFAEREAARAREEAEAESRKAREEAEAKAAAEREKADPPRKSKARS